jgi:hypothetical protein
MKRTPIGVKAERKWGAGLGLVILLIAVVLFASLSAPAAQGNPPVPPASSPTPYPIEDQPFPPDSPLPSLSAQQKRALLKDRFEKTRLQTAELVKLAQALQKDLDKSTPDILSVHVVKKAEAIEKLAKKIKDEARGY